jgi:hypothetical protein
MIIQPVVPGKEMLFEKVLNRERTSIKDQRYGLVT